MKTPSEMLNEQAAAERRDSPYGHPLVLFAQVKFAEDPTDARRVKARVKGMDDKTSDDDLPWCAPMLPILLGVNPQEGEAVVVIIPDHRKANSDRMWVGPIVSQYQKAASDPFSSTALNALSSGRQTLLPSYKATPESAEVFPDRDDTAFVGRDNVDIRMKPAEFTVVAAKHAKGDPSKENTKNPARLTAKGDAALENTYVVSQADYNFLISHRATPKPDPKMSDKEVAEIVKATQPMVKGQVLAEYLDLQRQAFAAHTHGYAGMETDKANTVQKLLEFDLKSILSDFNRLA